MILSPSPQTLTDFSAHKVELQEELSYLFLDTKLCFQPEKEIQPVSSPSSSSQVKFYQCFESRTDLSFDRVLARGNTEHDAVDYLHRHGIVHRDLKCAFLSPLADPRTSSTASRTLIVTLSLSTLASTSTSNSHPFPHLIQS